MNGGQNDLTALNNYIFEMIDMVTNEDLTGEALQEAITRSLAVARLADTVIRVGDLALKARAVAEDCGFNTGGQRQSLPKMLEAK